MTTDSVAHLKGQVQPLPVVLEHVDHTQTLFVMPEAARHQRVEDALAGMTEWCVAQVVPECDRLRELFVQAQHFGNGASDLRDLEAVRQTGSVVIARGREEDLSLVLQPPERLAVNDPIAIVLERRPDIVLRLRTKTAARVRTLGRLGRKRLALPLLERFTNARQRCPPESWCRERAGRHRSSRPASVRDRRTSRA